MVKTPYCQCPNMQRFFNIIGKKWTLFILHSVKEGSHSFTEIREKIGHANTKILTDRLAELVEYEILAKTSSGKYIFTPDGEDLTEKIIDISYWWTHRDQ